VSVPEIDVDTLAVHHANGAIVLDVRELAEYADGHVPGARLIPLGEVAERIAEVPDDRPLYVICRSGARSAKAAEWLLGQGIDSVNIAGGTLAWVATGRSVVVGGEPG
jgi:rhodanese-related sulfurtransferase